MILPAEVLLRRRCSADIIKNRYWHFLEPKMQGAYPVGLSMQESHRGHIPVHDMSTHIYQYTLHTHLPEHIVNLSRQKTGINKSPTKKQSRRLSYFLCNYRLKIHHLFSPPGPIDQICRGLILLDREYEKSPMGSSFTPPAYPTRQRLLAQPSYSR